MKNKIRQKINIFEKKSLFIDKNGVGVKKKVSRDIISREHELVFPLSYF